MTDFNKRKSTDNRNCSRCHMSAYHLSNGLLCCYDETKTERDEVCALYIEPLQKNLEAEIESKKQGELF
jgi:hypothetical protein